MARAFAAELGRHRIRVNSLHPGPVPTAMGSGDMLVALSKAFETNPTLVQMGGTPFTPDWGGVEPEDVAASAVWLASDEARHITAVALAIDNGMAQF